MEASRVSEMINPFNTRKNRFIMENKIVNNRGYFLFKERSVCPSAVKIMTDSKRYGTISAV